MSSTEPPRSTPPTGNVQLPLGQRTVDWSTHAGRPAVELIDQTALPDVERLLRLTTVDEVVDAIQRLAVRGAPAIGVAGGLGVALAAVTISDPAARDAAVAALRDARPTAVNLARAVDRVAAVLPDGPQRTLAEALAIRDEEIASSDSMAAYGVDLIGELCGAEPRLLTHCNTGGLATVTGGTALGVVFALHRAGRLGGVVASETRPLLQGARLTTWELGRAQIPFRVAVDGAGPFLIARGEVDAVIIGADRICANGDVVNKIGSYAHALGAARAGVPFVVVAPESTVDRQTPDGGAVEIEDRGSAELAPNLPAANPAFDVTPFDLVTAVVTDRRVVRFAAGQTWDDIPLGPLRSLS
ncbi:S-methyl-5-thioribose-1-phosphate isomerase [Cryptosporangium phraense]|uniref:S-methyl-5-thioribose-1-phosphate isomerase n=1 Tax=Cryptosporangium phraense TaxID=2593070 RepID=A0A545AR49_9ACTN|nr:S-methyl-5-thioribose-1-phosphate isomerase [Cryptosporangium phraense]TQS43711.1 S-methyl-5-thioribose-1-phosphate isomerase [Cryptosporangium phraense]